MGSRQSEMIRLMNRSFLAIFPHVIAGLVFALACAGCRPAAQPEAQAPEAKAVVAATDPWVRAFTADNRASVEFPLSPLEHEAVGGDGTNSARMFTVICNVTNKGISLRMSYSPIPAGQPAMPPLQRMEEIATSMQAQGFRLISTIEVAGLSAVYQIVADKGTDEQRFVIRMAIRPNMIYRVMAISLAGFHDDPMIPRFIGTFECKE